METKILIEPLSERLFMKSADGHLTFADSRALMVFADDLPVYPSDRPELITTQKYLVLESGDMLPYDVEDIQGVSFTKSEFEHIPRKREQVLKMLYGYISEYYTIDVDIEYLAEQMYEIMKEMGFYNFNEYHNDVITMFTSLQNEEIQSSNDNHETQIDKQ